MLKLYIPPVPRIGYDMVLKSTCSSLLWVPALAVLPWESDSITCKSSSTSCHDWYIVLEDLNLNKPATRADEITHRGDSGAGTENPVGPELAPAAPETSGDMVQHHPLGCMFSPELDQSGVVSIVSEILCHPPYTTGVMDEQRLLKQVKTGRVDVQTMSRLVRWLGGQRAGEGLRERGLKFVGPKLGTQPYSTGMGISCLLREVMQKHEAGTKFLISFSSNYDACAGTVAGVLVPAPPNLEDTMGCSSLGETAPPPRPPYSPPWSARASRSRDRKRLGIFPSSPSCHWKPDRRPSPVTAILYDEKPKHRDGAIPSSSRSRSAQEFDSVGKELCKKGVGTHRGGVFAMGVEEWVEAYGECDGPMLAAWVFDEKASRD